MGVFRQFPYSNFHDMNMDEIIKIVKNMLEDWAQYYAEWDAWMAEINEDWSNYQEVMNEAWQNMQDFINNYFDNLDVQVEINNKITSMVNSGQFADIVEPYIPPRVTEWLTANITQPVGVVIDTSLSVSGACADAKATGDAIAALKTDITANMEGVVDGKITPTFIWENGNIDSNGENANNNRTDYARTTNYIHYPFDVEMTYIMTSAAYRFVLAEYDMNGNFIQRVVSAELTDTFILSKNNKYRLCITLNDYLIVIDLNDLTPYLTITYATKFKDIANDITSLENEDNEINTKLAQVFDISPNLLNPETCTDGYYILKNGNITENDNAFISAPIAMKANVQYKVNHTLIRIRIQDANGNLLAVESEDTLPLSDGVFSYSTPAFAILSDSIANKATLMMCEASEMPENYVPYGVTLGLPMLESEISQSPINGKSVTWYGDSLIQNNWKNAVINAFSMDSTDCGVGGTKISGSDAASMCQASRINGEYPAIVDPNTGVTTQPVAIPDDAEIIIIGGGTNDWAQNVPLGEKQVQFSGSTIVEDVTTFYQACHCMFRRLAEERPNAKIIVLGTPYALYENRWANTYGLLNNLGLSALDYGKALCDVARMWGYFALDYGEFMGINESNVKTLLNPDSDGHLHPSTATAKQIFAECCTQRLLTIKYLY